MYSSQLEDQKRNNLLLKYFSENLLSVPEINELRKLLRVNRNLYEPSDQLVSEIHKKIDDLDMGADPPYHLVRRDTNEIITHMQVVHDEINSALNVP